MANRNLRVEIVGDASSLSKAFRNASSSAGGFGKTLAKTAKFAGLALGAAGIGGLAVVLKSGISEFAEAAKVGAQTNAVLKSTGQAAKVTAQEVSGLAEALMRKSGVDDEQIQAGENMLLTFTKIRNEVGAGNDIFNQATTASLNLSVAMGKDMTSSAILVGKALNDPLKGMTALNKAGIQFTQGQKDSIKAMVEAGNTMGAQKMILQELETQFGGSAVALGQTLPGQIEILKQSFANLSGEVVASLVPSFTKILNWTTANWPTIERGITGVFSAISTALGAAVGFFRTHWATITTIVRGALEGIQRAAEVAWPKVQQAAEKVMVWYRNHLQPTIISVSQNLARGWNVMWGKMKTDADGQSSGITKIVSANIKGMGNLINAVLATLRGDWAETWAQLKQVMVQAWRQYVGIMEGMRGLFSDAARAIGRAIIDGIVSGATGLGGRLKDKLIGEVSGTLGAVKDFIKSRSPSKLFADQVGKPIGEGIVVGAVAGLKTLSAASIKEINALQRQLTAISERRSAEDRARAVRDATAALADARKKKEGVAAAETELARAREDIVVAGMERQLAKEQALYDKRQALIEAKMAKLNAAVQRSQEKAAAIFDKMRDKVMRAFDATRGGMVTPAEAALAAIADRRKNDDLQKSLADAIAGGDSEAIARAEEDIHIASLERQAQTERTALDQQTEALRENLQERLDVWKGGTAGILTMLKGFGVDFETVGVLLGTAFRNSLIASINATGKNGGGMSASVSAGGGNQGLAATTNLIVDGEVLASSTQKYLLRQQGRNGTLGFV